jgi:hypothetical protein
VSHAALNPGFASGTAPTAATSKVPKAGSIIVTDNGDTAAGACKLP